MSVLMLRGAQTPGELKQRTDRMHAFGDLDGVQETLGHLIERRLAARMPRRPGQKEERFMQLLDAGEPDSGPAPADGAEGAAHAEQGASALDSLLSRVERLEREVAELRDGAPAGMRDPSEREP
jgi:uncharacterized protein YceH (UPF0502 family)